jgi:A/G-specific adenine glycosylase
LELSTELTPGTPRHPASHGHRSQGQGKSRSILPDAAVLSSMGRLIAEWGTGIGGGSRRPELPWRSTRDPWAVLVSEVMAQQTQVSRVVPAYRLFLQRFPTPTACAEASLGEVLRAWQGLGYNRRALNLHRAATAMVADHRGEVPGTLRSLLALPGVGAYTARAVLAFAFEADVGVVDTNAGRVLARAAAGRSIRPGDAQRLVDEMVPPGEAWAFGQALLDLGASVCTASGPRCGQCPLVGGCRWEASGLDGPDPAVGSAGVSTAQSTFVGSDRQGRGRLIDRLRQGTVAPDQVAGAAGWPEDPERAERVVLGLLGEGLIVRDSAGELSLP